MANTVYPIALKKILDAFGCLTDDIKIVLLESGYVYSAAHDFLDDITGTDIVATSPALSGKTTTAGVFVAADPTYAALTGSPATSMVVIKDSGSAATSPLISYHDTWADGTAFLVVPTGADYVLDLAATGLFRI